MLSMIVKSVSFFLTLLCIWAGSVIAEDFDMKGPFTWETAPCTHIEYKQWNPGGTQHPGGVPALKEWKVDPDTGLISLVYYPEEERTIAHLEDYELYSIQTYYYNGTTYGWEHHVGRGNPRSFVGGASGPGLRIPYEENWRQYPDCIEPGPPPPPECEEDSVEWNGECVYCPSGQFQYLMGTCIGPELGRPGECL